MSDPLMQKLRKIAEAATQGEWEFQPSGDSECGEPQCCSEYWDNRIWADGMVIAESHHLSDTDADHIAAFDPTTVLALIDEIERLRTITDAQVEAAAEVLTLDIDGSEWDEISPKAQDKVRELARQCLEAAREARETTAPSEGIPF